MLKPKNVKLLVIIIIIIVIAFGTRQLVYKYVDLKGTKVQQVHDEHEEGEVHVEGDEHKEGTMEESSGLMNHGSL